MMAEIQFQAPRTENVACSASQIQVCGRHVVSLTSRLGSNQHRGIERGECVYCGKPFMRWIHWARREVTDWFSAQLQGGEDGD